MPSQSVIDTFLEKGCRLTLLKGKKPILTDWVNKSVARNKLIAHKDNLAWVLSSKDIVIDVDSRHGGMESIENLIEDLNLSPDFLQPTVYTPGGGYHIYTRIPDKWVNKKLKKKLKKYPGIEFLSHGASSTIPTSKTEQGEYVWANEKIGFNQIEIPEAIIRTIQSISVSIGQSKPDKTDSGTQVQTLESAVNQGHETKWSQERVIDCLKKLSPSMPNDDWVRVGMALHCWDSSLGLKMWEAWSRKGNNYTPGETEKRWRSFDNEEITLGTLDWMAREADYNSECHQVDNIIKHIGQVPDQKTLEMDVVSEVRKIDLSVLNLEKIALAIQNRIKDITKIRLPINEIRNMISKPEILDVSDKQNTAPKWCNDWIYVNSHRSFFNTKNYNLYKSEAFNVRCGRLVPENEKGRKIPATKFVSDNGYVNIAENMAYLPFFEELIYEVDHTRTINTFNPKSLPRTADNYSEDGLEALGRIQRHIQLICTTNKDTGIFTEWLAHQIQFPGRKILWSPVIQSIQGIGKSFFGELLRACLGNRNVGTVAPSQTTSDFNGWATNVCVNILEELRIQGHNRYEIVNALKPLITDSTIQINEKSVKPYITHNTANYLCFTNYKDSLPLSVDDRRWWVIFVPIQSLAELSEKVNEPIDEYFPNLFQCIRSHAGEVRKWLLEYPISDTFKTTMQAPQTDHKLAMIATEDASIDGLHEVIEIIQTGGKYFNEMVISCPDLFDAVLIKYPELDIKTSARNIILKKLGYTVLPKQVNVDGKTRRIWTKKPMTTDEVREHLKVKNEPVKDDVII